MQWSSFNTHAHRRGGREGGALTIIRTQKTYLNLACTLAGFNVHKNSTNETQALFPHHLHHHFEDLSASPSPKHWKQLWHANEFLACLLAFFLFHPSLPLFTSFITLFARGSHTVSSCYHGRHRGQTLHSLLLQQHCLSCKQISIHSSLRLNPSEEIQLNSLMTIQPFLPVDPDSNPDNKTKLFSRGSSCPAQPVIMRAGGAVTLHASWGFGHYGVPTSRSPPKFTVWVRFLSFYRAISVLQWLGNRVWVQYFCCSQSEADNEKSGTLQEGRNIFIFIYIYICKMYAYIERGGGSVTNPSCCFHDLSFYVFMG